MKDYSISMLLRLLLPVIFVAACADEQCARPPASACGNVPARYTRASGTLRASIEDAPMMGFSAAVDEAEVTGLGPQLFVQACAFADTCGAVESWRMGMLFQLPAPIRHATAPCAAGSITPPGVTGNLTHVPSRRELRFDQAHPASGTIDLTYFDPETNEIRGEGDIVVEGAPVSISLDLHW